ncbi:MAG: DUF4430 domain-containing protein [Lachnospiraceae bacterium]|nr:DUF4430 domain-containing protein [Lachnospiraceae bacterium]
MKTVLCGLCAVLLSLLLIPAAGAESPSDPSGEYEAGILSYLSETSGADSVQAWLDRDAEELFKTPAEWYFLALYQGGKYDFTSFAQQYRRRLPDGQSKLAGATWLNRIMTAWLLGMETDADEVRQHTAAGDIMSLVYGLHYSTVSKEAFVSPASLTERQCEDGGWSLKGDFGDPDVTSMVLTALAPYYETDEAVKAAADRGVEYLSKKQLPNGGYSSFGTDNCESASQVVIALCSLGINPMTDARFQKEGGNPLTTMGRFRCENGTFAHKEGGTGAEITTAEVLCALTSYRRFLTGKTPLYQAERSDVWGTDPKEDDRKPDDNGNKPEDGSSVSAESTPGGKNAGKDSREAEKGFFGAEPYKFIVSGVIVLLLAVSIILLKVRKRLTKKNGLFAAGLAALLIILTFATRFESVGKHYTGGEMPDAIGSVTLTIRCDTIAGEQGAPKDSVILPVTEVKIADGDTAFDVIVRAAKEHRIAMDYTGSGGSVYVKGIAGLYEFAYGNMSGWIYLVNGEIMAVGCGQAEVKPGDEISFQYTKNLGEDLK